MADLTLTETADGGRFRIRVGDVVTLHLSENAAAGYRWTVSDSDDVRVEVRRRGFELPNPAVGSAGVAVWTLTPKSAGTSHVTLKKSRPWEPPSASSETFTITLDASE